MARDKKVDALHLCKDYETNRLETPLIADGSASACSTAANAGCYLPSKTKAIKRDALWNLMMSFASVFMSANAK